MSKRPLRGAPAARHIGVRVTVAEHRALRVLARANSLTLSSMVAEAVAVWAGDMGERPPLACRYTPCDACPFCCSTHRTD